MPIVINPASEVGKELRKWEQHHTVYALDENYESKPGNPYTFREYPKMLYQAARRPNGQAACQLAPPPLNAFSGPQAVDEWNRETLAIESFNVAHRKVVGDEAAERIAVGQGWCLTQQAALDRYEQEQIAIGNAAAEVAAKVKTMSPKAQAEYAAAEETTIEHVTDIKPAKKSHYKKRGRPFKKVVAVSGDREHGSED